MWRKGAAGTFALCCLIIVALMIANFDRITAVQDKVAINAAAAWIDTHWGPAEDLQFSAEWEDGSWLIRAHLKPNPRTDWRGFTFPLFVDVSPNGHVVGAM